MYNIASMVSLEASSKDLELIYSVSEDIPEKIIGDPLRVSQVLTNLTNNAVKFTNEGHVYMHASLENLEDKHAKILFRVEDTGIGISPKNIKNLFSSFSQADSSVTRKYGGSGLGLSISNKLVALMNSQLKVESQVGKGSQFSFVIDFEVQERSKKDRQLPKQIQDIKILIVDDNKLTRDLLVEQLKYGGIHAKAVSSGREALGEIKGDEQQSKYDLIFMDWKMPDMDGLTVAEKILKNEDEGHTPMIIMITAFGRERIMKKAEEVGIEGFLMKPISPHILFRTIKDVFGEYDGTEGELQVKYPVLEQGIHKKILLVEDTILNQQVASEMLKNAGFEVDIAGDGKEALERVTIFTYDLVLMDIQMPVMGGYEATREIRKLSWLKELPIIAMTAHAIGGARDRCIEAGMNDFISKPVTSNELFKVLKNWLKCRF